MKKIQDLATNLGFGIGSAYAFFLIPSIADLFSPTFMVLLKQILAISFAVCLLISPKSLVEVGEKFGPKLITILNTLFGKNKSDS